jgi:hypothetical protein
MPWVVWMATNRFGAASGPGAPNSRGEDSSAGKARRTPEDRRNPRREREGRVFMEGGGYFWRKMGEAMSSIRRVWTPN